MNSHLYPISQSELLEALEHNAFNNTDYKVEKTLANADRCINYIYNLIIEGMSPMQDVKEFEKNIDLVLGKVA